MEFQLLGPVQVRAAGAIMDAGPPRQRAVLAALLVDAGRVVLGDTIVDRVWGQSPPEQARHSLYVYIARLRQILGPVPLLRRSRGYLLDVDPDRVDAHRFRALVEQARDPHSIDSQRADLLRQALRLWRGTPLADIEGEWASQVREVWRRQHLEAATAWARAERQCGDARTVISELTSLSNDYPLAEPLAAELMRALHTAGLSAEALSCYGEVRQRLDTELGIEPGNELTELHRAILRNEATVPRAGVAGAPVIPHQLPAAPHQFAGRRAEIAALSALDLSRNGGLVVITGTAGVGKTSFAVHWGHEVADRFPDGQLYADLRGFAPGGPRLHPKQVLRGFLRALGHPPSRIAVEHDLSAAFRTAMFGRRMLILLDNAHDADQVRPLLPGAGGCLTIATSRAQLRGLSITDGAHLMTLELLSAEDALELLTQRLGPQRVAAYPSASAQIVDFCAHLPLALATVAANAASQPNVPLPLFAEQLADVRDRLDALDSGETTTQLRAVFSWSYDRLTEETARLFRLLGLHPGPDVGVDAAASLAGRPATEIRPLLAELTRAHLVTEPNAGRYGFHDLLRAYATEQAANDDTQARDAARRRMLDHYRLTAIAASRLLNPGRILIAPPRAEPRVTVTEPGDLTAALEWFRTERSALVRAVDLAASRPGHHTWQLAWSAVDYLDRQGHWPEWVATQEVALAAARRENDVEGQAHTHRGLGRAKVRMSRYDEAGYHLRQALSRFRRLGHGPMEARTHLDLSELLEKSSKHEPALRHAQKALDLYVALEDQAGQARALNAVGWDHAQLGRYEQALTFCQQSLAVHQKAGDRSGQAAVWDSLGFIHRRLGKNADAVTCYTRSRDLYSTLGDRFHEADTLCLLAGIHDATGNHAQAQDTWKTALKILDELRHPQADQIRARLAGRSAA